MPLANVLEGGETWAVVRVPYALNKPLTIDIEVAFSTLDGVECSTLAHCTLPVGSSAEENPSASVLRERVKELEAAKLQKDAMREAQRGNWAGVQHIVGNINAIAGNNAYVAGVGQTLERLSATQNANLLSKEAVYGARAMSSRTVSLNEDVTRLVDEYGLKKSQQGKS